MPEDDSKVEVDNYSQNDAKALAVRFAKQVPKELVKEVGIFGSVSEGSDQVGDLDLVFFVDKPLAKEWYLYSRSLGIKGGEDIPYKNKGTELDKLVSFVQ